MFAFHVWISIAHPIDEGLIVSSLVKKGYKVSAASSNGQLCLQSHNNISLMMALRIDKELVVAQELYDDIYSILDSNNILYTGLVISEFSLNSLWNSGNIADENQMLPIIAKSSSSKKSIN